MAISFEETHRHFNSEQPRTPVLNVSSSDKGWRFTFHRQYLPENSFQQHFDGVIRISGVYAKLVKDRLKADDRINKFCLSGHHQNDFLLYPIHKNLHLFLSVIKEYLPETTYARIDTFYRSPLILTKEVQGKFEQVNNINGLLQVIKSQPIYQTPGYRSLIDDLAGQEPSEKLFTLLNNASIGLYASFYSPHSNPKDLLAEHLFNAGFKYLARKVTLGSYNF